MITAKDGDDGMVAESGSASERKQKGGGDLTHVETELK